MKKAVALAAGVVVVALLAGSVALVRWRSRDHGTAAPTRPQYHCPMHPQVTSERPGSCPICGMDLVRSQPAAATPASAQGMAGRAAVTLSAERRAVLGLRTEPVRRVALERTIRTVGRVTVDERRVHHVHTKVEAYIEHLHVDFIGKFVTRGEALASVYSPELVASQQEYLLALEGRKRLAESGIPGVSQGGVDLLEATRQRLLRWDVPRAHIARLEEAGEVQRTLDLVSPVSGYVVGKTAQHGMRVTPSDSLFDIADLSHLWVLADVYESDLPAVHLGMPAEIGLSYLPGRRWQGQVTWVAPTVDPQTRTVKVRVEVDNAGGHLKPEMYADVSLTSRAGEGLVVPDGSILNSGERQLVFVDLGDGRLEPREVKVGPKASAGTQILSGVREGENVVTAANFLLDSESSLKAALLALSPAPGPAPAGAASPPAGHGGH